MVHRVPKICIRRVTIVICWSLVVCWSFVGRLLVICWSFVVFVVGVLLLNFTKTEHKVHFGHFFGNNCFHELKKIYLFGKMVTIAKL